ncbi:phage head closure protein [Herminiimonas sp. CN]|uniref:phage head closure protein n=1 Tax=Herminiimonas sp. CN TaxID=1349818 RepID=UPI00068421A9|nr:phage head closure protein [Herminiimonas sp. CN]
MNRRITLQQRSTAQDAYGAQVDTWTTLGDLWASIEPLTGRELMAAQAVQSEVSHKITIRYQAQFANPQQVAAMRISYQGRMFNIHASMDIEEAHKIIEILATEGVNQG